MRCNTLLCAIALMAACSTSNPNGAVQAVPVTSTLTAKGLGNPVDVVRDEWGIPHIYGQSLPDVSYAQGYFMAQDRWVELDILRRAADGSLAGLFGAGQLANDIGMRVHHLRKTAQTGLAALTASSDPNDKLLVQILQRFADGVNAWQADLATGKAGPLPTGIESLYTAASVTPWLPEDSLLLGEFVAWQLAFDDQTDVVRTDLDLAVAQTYAANDPRAKMAEDVDNTSPPDPAVILPGGWGFNLDGSSARREPVKLKDWQRSTAGKQFRKLLDDDVHALANLGFVSPQQVLRGSNNWVIGPKLSSTGHVLVANDTHLSLQNPPIFYMNHLIARSGSQTLLNVMGEQFPGMPLVILGMNQHSAWGATVSYLDVTDIYSIAVAPCSGGFCTTFNGNSVPLTTRTETFDVGALGQVSKAAATVTFYDDPNHGPLIPRLNPDNSLQPLRAKELSIRYTGYTTAPLLKAIYGLDTAASMPAAVAALDKYFRYGGQNWVIGDDQGNFGWTETVQVPLRNLPQGRTGLVPFKVLPGDGTAEWGSDMDPRNIPHAFNHPQNYISTANNDPIGTTLKNDPFYGQPLADGGTTHLYLGVDYDPGTREGRIESRINDIAQDGGKLSLDTLSSIQADTISEYGQLLAPTFLDAVGALAAAGRGKGDGGPMDVTAYALDAGPTLQPLFQQAHDWVAAWSFQTPSGISDPDAGAPTPQEAADSKAQLVMGVWEHYYLHAILDDELVALGSPNAGPFPLPDQLLLSTGIRLTLHPDQTASAISQVTGDPVLFDDVSTPAVVESKRQIAARAALAALQFIVQQEGPFPANWSWGQIHTLTVKFAVPGLGVNIPPPGDYYAGGFPRHGADGTVDVGGNSASLTDFTYSEGPAIRFTCELDPDAGPHGRNILPGGEIFDPKSPHYRDQMELWRKNQTVDWAFRDQDVLNSAQTENSRNKIGRTHFQP